MFNVKLTDLILIKKNFLTDAQCDLLIQEYELRQENSVSETSIHAITGNKERSTFKCIDLLPGSETFNIIHNNTKTIVNTWVKYLESFKAFHIPSFNRHLHYAHRHRLLKYSTGASIHPHIDWGPFIHASCTFNLNSNYNGGEFAFFNGQHTITLGKGDALIFPADSFWVHEVKPVTNGVRYSTNSFITSLPDDIQRNLLNSLNTITIDDSELDLKK